MAAHMELLTGLVLWRQRKSWKRAHVNYVCAPKDMRTLDCFSFTQSSPGTVFADPFPWQESLGESLANSLSNIREHDCPSTTPNLNYMTISCPGSCVLTSKEVEALRSAEKKKKVKFGQTSCGIILFHWVMRPGFKYPKEVLVSRWSCSAWSGDCEWPVCHSDSHHDHASTPQPMDTGGRSHAVPVQSRRKPVWKTAIIKGFVDWKENGKQKRVTVFQWPLGHSLSNGF